MDSLFLAENNVGVIPHYYTVEDKMYDDGEELTIREFYDAMRAKKKAGTMKSWLSDQGGESDCKG